LPRFLRASANVAQQGQLAEIYADVLPGEGRLLAAKTTDAAKTAYLSGAPAADDALRLHQHWTELIGDPDDPGNPLDGPLGMLCAMYTFDELAGELAGKMARRGALGQVTNAAKLPDPRVPAPTGPRLVRLGADEADENSPAVQLMRKYEDVARLAAHQHNTGLLCDPDQLYSVVFG
jgi:hypothetical protein